MQLSISKIVVSLLAGLASARVVERYTTSKPIFAHYMIGEINDDHVRQDIVDAKALGIDGFAMNFDQFAYWSNNTVDRLFNNADSVGGFGLFFSFDHGAGRLPVPTTYVEYLKKYISRQSYFRYNNNRPLVSTFGGENIDWADFKRAAGDVLLIPGFYQAQPSTTFFSNRPNIDGIFNWNSWPISSAGSGAVVSSADDAQYNTAAHNTGRFFMMGVSPIQVKHIDSNQNWYRRGEDNLENRFGQVLALQPDMIQLQTWNDGGEGHYMGTLWPEPMTNSPITKLVNGYDHKGYWQVLPAFIQAWKRGDRNTANMYPTNGKTVQGTFWHHTLTRDATCNDPLPKSTDITKNVEDVVSGIVLVQAGKTNLVAVVRSGTKELTHVKLNPGYNKFKLPGLVTGKVQLEVWDGSTMIGGGYAPIAVTDTTSLCNYNFQVVGFPS